MKSAELLSVGSCLGSWFSLFFVCLPFSATTYAPSSSSSCLHGASSRDSIQSHRLSLPVNHLNAIIRRIELLFFTLLCAEIKIPEGKTSDDDSKISVLRKSFKKSAASRKFQQKKNSIYLSAQFNSVVKSHSFKKASKFTNN